MAVGSLLLGIINIAIVVAIMVLVGAVIVMFANWFKWPIDWNVQRLYLLLVLLVALYMVVALLFGLPSMRVIGGGFRAEAAVIGATAATVSFGTSVHL